MIKDKDCLTWDHQLLLSVPIPIFISLNFYTDLSFFLILILLGGWCSFCLIKFFSLHFVLLQILLISSFSLVCFFEQMYFMQKKSVLEDTVHIEFSGILYDIPKRTEQAYSFSVKTTFQNQDMIFRVLATKDLLKQTAQKMEKLSVGSVLQIKGTIAKNRGFQNVYGFDSEQYARQMHQIASVFLSEIPVVHSKKQTSFRGLILPFRQMILEKIAQHLSDTPAQAYIAALVFGERSNMDDEIADLYQKYGLVHLLAISGMQIHLFTFGLFVCLLRVGFTKEHVYIFLFFLQPVLYLMTGASTSVARACLTTAFFLLCCIFSVKKDPSFPIVLAFFFSVYTNPDIVLDIGFQLSFFLSACLIFSRNILGRIQSRWMQMFMASFICQLASLPIVLFHFHTYAPLGFILNLVFIPFINFFVFPLGLIVLVCILLNLPFSFLSAILNQGVHWSETLLRWIEHVLEYSLYFAHPPLFLFLAEWVSLFFLFTSVERRGWKKSKLFLSVWAGTLLLHYISPQLNPTASVTFLDVGQGDCTVLITPYQKEVIFIDSGGALLFLGEERNMQIVEQVILPFLHAKGIREIDYYIATHGDMDHIGTFLNLAQTVSIQHLILGEKAKYTELENQAEKYMRSTGKSVQKIKQGAQLPLQNGTLFCLSPTGMETKSNAGSVILLAKLYDHTIYMMGDAEKQREYELTKQFQLPTADILKVGHHGSQTSSEVTFIREISPQFSILSLGAQNSYGHPHQETMQTLESYGKIILRTDQEGQITFVLRKNHVTFFTKNHMLKKESIP